MDSSLPLASHKKKASTPPVSLDFCPLATRKSYTEATWFRLSGLRDEIRRLRLGRGRILDGRKFILPLVCSIGTEMEMWLFISRILGDFGRATTLPRCVSQKILGRSGIVYIASGRRQRSLPRSIQVESG